MSCEFWHLNAVDFVNQGSKLKYFFPISILFRLPVFIFSVFVFGLKYRFLYFSFSVSIPGFNGLNRYSKSVSNIGFKLVQTLRESIAF